MSNRFNIEIPDITVTKLAGNRFGKKVFDEQVREKIDYGGKIVIIFPTCIDYLASSFIQGFFEDIVSNIEVNGIEERVEIISGIKDAKKSIIAELR